MAFNNYFTEKHRKKLKIRAGRYNILIYLKNGGATHVDVDRALLITVIVVLFLALAGCLNDNPKEKTPLYVKTAPTDAQLNPSDDGVDGFLVKNRAFTAGYEDDACFNVTPDFVSEYSDFQIFKYDKSAASFLQYDGEVYALGEHIGGCGVTSFALAYLNTDGRYELYFAFSWGSGLHRAQVGCFDPVKKEASVFDYALMDADLMLTQGEDGALSVCRAELGMKSFVELSAAPKETVGTIAWQNEDIKLDAAEAAAK